jgi:hypothetical protein
LLIEILTRQLLTGAEEQIARLGWLKGLRVGADVALQVYQAKRSEWPSRKNLQKLTKKLRMVEETVCTEESRGSDVKEDQKERREEIAQTPSPTPNLRCKFQLTKTTKGIEQRREEAEET